MSRPLMRGLHALLVYIVRRLRITHPAVICGGVVAFAGDTGVLKAFAGCLAGDRVIPLGLVPICAPFAGISGGRIALAACSGG